jgi:hypothetical protein
LSALPTSKTIFILPVKLLLFHHPKGSTINFSKHDNLPRKPKPSKAATERKQRHVCCLYRDLHVRRSFGSLSALYSKKVVIKVKIKAERKKKILSYKYSKSIHFNLEVVGFFIKEVESHALEYK